MDDATEIIGQLFGEPVADIRRWSRNDRWPEGIINTGRYPAMGIAQTDSELEEIGRLRYDLFIDRDGKRDAHADHTKKVFLDAPGFRTSHLRGPETGNMGNSPSVNADGAGHGRSNLHCREFGRGVAGAFRLAGNRSLA